MSNISASDGGSFSSGAQVHELQPHPQKLFSHFNVSNLVPSSSATSNSNGSTSQQQQPPTVKKRRSLPGNPDPNAEVIALSPKSLMATNRFVCEICNKGFQRDQNLQLHRRGHNLPWKLRQRTTNEIRKRVYVCPEPSCVHHNPARALGDLTGIKKHFCRKHGEKKWKCDRCSKKYAVQSDWKAHSKTCGTKEYKCDCGTIFSRRDSFITHRAFCDALTEENTKPNQALIANMEGTNIQGHVLELMSSISEFSQPPPDAKIPIKPLIPMVQPPPPPNLFSTNSFFGGPRMISNPSSSTLHLNPNSSSLLENSSAAHLSATALLQKAAHMGATSSMQIKTFAANSMAPNNSSFSGMLGGSLYEHNIQTQMNHPPPRFFDAKESAAAGMGNMGIFPGLIFNQNHGLILDNKEGLGVDRSCKTNNDFATGLSRFTGNSSGPNDTMTVDFLGIGGTRPPRDFHGLESDHHHHHQEVELEAIGGLSPFQQQISTGQATCENSVWNINLI